MNILPALSLAAGIAVCAPYAAAQTQIHPAQAQLQQNIDSVLKVVHDKSLGEQQKIRQIERYADSYLDYRRLSALAVGLPWKTFTPQQQNDFIAAFKEMMISMYARSALLGAEKSRVRVLPKIKDNGGGKIDTYSEVLAPNGKKYEVSYQFYASGGVYKVYNIRVDGISMVTVYRNQLNDLIKQKGIDGAIGAIRAKSLKKAESM